MNIISEYDVYEFVLNHEEAIKDHIAQGIAKYDIFMDSPAYKDILESYKLMKVQDYVITNSGFGIDVVITFIDANFELMRRF